MRLFSNTRRISMWLVCALCLAIGAVVARRSSPPPFDREKWIAGYNNFEMRKMRNAMVTDLISHHLKPGMSRRDIKRLLGSPTHERNDEMAYRMGFPYFFSDDPEILLIRLSDGRITEAVVRTI